MSMGFQSLDLLYLINSVGSRLSESQLSEFLIIQSLGRHHVFGSSGKKTFWSLKFCYSRKQSCCMNDFSQMLQCLFHPVWDLDHDLQRLSYVAERSREHCSTLYYSVAKLKGRVSRTILGFNHSHMIRPCAWFISPGDYFRTTETGLCLRSPKSSLGKIVIRKC